MKPFIFLVSSLIYLFGCLLIYKSESQAHASDSLPGSPQAAAALPAESRLIPGKVSAALEEAAILREPGHLPTLKISAKATQSEFVRGLEFGFSQGAAMGIICSLQVRGEGLTPEELSSAWDAIKAKIEKATDHFPFEVKIEKKIP